MFALSATRTEAARTGEGGRRGGRRPSRVTGEPSQAVRTLCAIAIGSLVIVHVALGGMPGATFIQVVKAVMLVSGVAIMAVLVLTRFHWNVNALRSGATRGAAASGSASWSPGCATAPGPPASSTSSVWSGHRRGPRRAPHGVMRLLAPRTNRVLRTSVVRAMGLVGFVCLAAGILGLGATAILGRENIAKIDPRGDATVLLLAQSLGGGLLTALISCLAFVTLLAVAAGLTSAAASSLAHDLYGEVIRKG